MKYKTPLLILIIGTLIIGLGFLFVKNYRNKFVTPIKQITTPTKETKEKVTLDLYLEPEQTTAKVGDIVNFLVRIDTKNLVLIATEAYLQYDPKIINIQSVQPGTVLASPNILLNKIDSQIGKISYALGTFQPSPSNGLLFTISGKIKALPARNIIDLAFDKNAIKIGLQSPLTSKIYAADEIQVLYHESQMNITQ